jgi:hypothetical protein
LTSLTSLTSGRPSFKSFIPRWEKCSRRGSVVGRVKRKRIETKITGLLPGDFLTKMLKKLQPVKICFRGVNVMITIVAILTNFWWSIWRFSWRLCYDSFFCTKFLAPIEKILPKIFLRIIF